MFGNFDGKRSARRFEKARGQQQSESNGRRRAGRSRTPIFELLEQRAMLTTVYTPLPATADGAAGSLRADIAAANADTGSQPDIIQLSAGAYNLTSGSGELDITNTTHTLIIDGAGMGQTTIDQHFADRVFGIASGANVVFENLEITGGSADTDSGGGSTEADGGGILNLGTLALTSVEVDHNRALEAAAGESALGGGVYSTGALTINGGSVISDNNADAAAGSAGDNGGAAYGGGIYVSTTDKVAITDTTIGGNDSLAGSGGDGTTTAGGTGGHAYGGGVYISANISSNAIFNDDTIAGNAVSGGAGGAGAVGFDGGSGVVGIGGGIDVDSAGPVTISGTTISGNMATGGNGGTKGTGGSAGGGGFAFGGGAEIEAAGSQMSNDTIYGNTATGGSGQTSGNASGGGIDDDSTGLTIVNVTVASNTAAVVAPVTGGTAGTPLGGGISNYTNIDSHLVLYNTLVATNTAAGSPDFNGAAATASSNLLGDGTGATGFSGAGDNNQVGTGASPINPLFALAGLTNNGGNTNTVALQTLSPALGAGNVAAAVANGLTTDQRGTGFARVVNSAVDIGAVEAQAASTTTSLLAIPNPAVVGQTVTFTAIVAPSGGATGMPTGTVQFKDGGVDIGPAETLSLVNGAYQATYSTSSLTVAASPHSITAVYSGDTSFSTSTSSSVSEVINLANTSTSLVATPNPATVGQNVSFTAIVAPTGGGSGAPTGTVQFKDGGVAIGPAETLALVNGAYQATYSTSTLTLGGHTITAVYSGDTNFSTSTSSSVTQTINAGVTTTQFANLTSYYNVEGITTDGTTFSGGLDGQGNALSETLVGRTLAWNGLTFPIAAPNMNNVVLASGQTVEMPTGSFSSLAVLATATNGSQASQTFVINYTTGGPTTVVQSISDWHTPQNYAGESIALTSNYRNTANGGRDSGAPFDVYGYSLPVDPTRTVESITLPNNSNVKILSIAAVAPVSVPTNLTALAATTTSVNLTWTAASGTITGYNVYRGTTAGGESATPIATLSSTTTTYSDTGRLAGNTYYYTVRAINYPAYSAASNEASLTMPTSGLTTPVDLSSDYNLVGITTTGVQFSGGLDGAGNAYSANVLGTSQTINGVGYTIAQGGTNNVIQADAQTIGLPLSSSYSTLKILATAVNGSQTNQTFTVNYTNSTSQTFNQSISDWHSPQTFTGESVAVSSSSRNISNGGTDDNGPFDIYAYSFTLTIPAGFDIESITLPTNSNVDILAITMD